MHVVSQPTSAEEYVRLLEAEGGDLTSFCCKNCPSVTFEAWLFNIECLLDDKPNLKKRWDKALARGLDIKLNIMQFKAMDFLSKWSNPSATSGAAEIAWAKTILSDLFVGRSEHSKRTAAQPFVKELKDMLAAAQDVAKPTENKELDSLEEEMSA